ncbi:MAG: hypothetical protein A2293_00785 [Elusimicrobia bacterium RIFOXYB2_FULL_49_7]|nr:MAG: hypothetical protein A2293_00785 [Elusimicrobia bacterium RIFOXYB2_FULL_49_7]
MKTCLLSFLSVFLLGGCAAYKELKPLPPPASVEGKYLPVRKEDKQFDLKKEKQYFIAFPAPSENHFYLVLKSPDKKTVSFSLTDSLAKQSVPGPRIADEFKDSADIAVYPITHAKSGYYLLFENIREERTLTLEYRYVPQWRFKFENKYAYYRDIIKTHAVDRLYYKEINSQNHFEDFNYALAIDTITRHQTVLKGIQDEFIALDSLFPANILNSNDPAYQNYTVLRKVLEDELRFQKDYLTALRFFGREYETQGKIVEFIKAAGELSVFFNEKEHLASNVTQEGKDILKKRLAEFLPYFDPLIAAKTDGEPLDSVAFVTTATAKVPELYGNAEVPLSAETDLLFRFLTDYHSNAVKTNTLKDSLEAIKKAVREIPEMPTDGLFSAMEKRLMLLEKAIPSQMTAAQYNKYGSMRCVTAFNAASLQFGSGVVKMAGLCREAEVLVAQLNQRRQKNDFTGMLTILLSQPSLAFLQEKYKTLDRLSVDQQKGEIGAALGAGLFGTAEAGLFKLDRDKNFINLAQIKPVRERAVLDLEDTLYRKVDLTTRARVDVFLEEKVHTLTDVDSLYTDSVFLPVHDITFTSGTRTDLVQRKADLADHLAKLKENEFPAKAVRLLYDEFIKSPSDSGVYKARAIVTHGNHYKGDDKEIKIRLAECDPLTAKWIVKPADYRRLFALPVTNREKGKNQYMIRLNVDVPTEAQFPVWDVNIKLPKAVVKNAADERWYDQITLNKKELKNEGRFTITAPTADNDYECQITPVQMSKTQRNVLEIRFSYPGLHVFNVSLMVQKPIIKKN